MRDIRLKILDRSVIRKVLGEEKKNGKRVVFTNGCFDILHIGHVRYLREAKKLGDLLVVGINSDDSVKKIKGEKRPLVPQDQRAEILASLRSVDYVVVFEEEEPGNIIKEVDPHVLVKGGDWKPDEIVGRDFVESRGGQVVLIDPVPGVSTTRIIKLICDRFCNGKSG